MEWLPNIELTDEPADDWWKQHQSYYKQKYPHKYSDGPSCGYQFGDACANCGHPKNELVDLGNEWYYECWYCEKRAAGIEEIPP